MDGARKNAKNRQTPPSAPLSPCAAPRSKRHSLHCAYPTVANWNVRKLRRRMNLRHFHCSHDHRDVHTVVNCTCGTPTDLSSMWVCSCGVAPTRGTPPSPSSFSSSTPLFQSPRQTPQFWAHHQPYLPPLFESSTSCSESVTSFSFKFSTCNSMGKPINPNSFFARSLKRRSAKNSDCSSFNSKMIFVPRLTSPCTIHPNRSLLFPSIFPRATR